MTDFSFQAAQIVECVQQATHALSRPSVIMRPRLILDGDQWCAVYGDDLQVGLAGFGRTPAAAMEAFDTAYFSMMPPQRKERP